MQKKPVILTTERIVLRPWKDSDYAPFYVMSSDPIVSEYLPPFPDQKACNAFVDRLRSDFSARGWGFWALEQKEGGDFMGMAGMHEPGPEFGVGRPCVEIGWRLAPFFWGKGLATEAAREVLRFAFEELQLDEIVSFTAVGNIRSVHVMKRLGMELEKEFDLLLLPPGHPHRPHYLYVLSRRQRMAKK
jgi:RimJ/RimL family protein N-acetyltransferase